MKLMKLKKTIIKVISYLFTFGFVFGLLFFNSIGSNKAIAENNKTNKNDIPDSNYFFETFTGDDLKIGKIGLFSSCDEVLKYLGKPKKKYQVKKPAINNPDYNTYIDTWVYPGIEIRFLTSVKEGNSAPEKPNQVDGIVITGQKYATKRGIKIGDSIVNVFKRYGYMDQYNNSYTYGVDLVYIKFFVSKEKISKIEIGGYPD